MSITPEKLNALNCAVQLLTKAAGELRSEAENLRTKNCHCTASKLAGIAMWCDSNAQDIIEALEQGEVPAGRASR